jgi:hypothetical protein
MTSNSEIEQLYEQDYNLWIERSLATLKNRDGIHLDWKNISQEIEEVGKSQKRALESYFQRLIEPILKMDHWETERERNLVHWKIEVRNFRIQIAKLDSPSLKPYLEEKYQEWYREIYDDLQKEFKLPSQYTIEKLDKFLDPDYFGGNRD